MRPSRSALSSISIAPLLLLTTLPAKAGCPEEPPLFNFSGPGQVVCPCFIAGEEAGSVLDAPAAHYPIEIIRVGIGWGSQFGGAPTSLEESINFYAAGLPDPGLPVFSLGGPQLADGFINEFDLEAVNSTVEMAGGPFSVTLRFLNDNAGDFFAPSVVHDGNGCTPGASLVKAIPGGWADACNLGVTGDWVFFIVYRPNCSTGIEERIVSSHPAAILGASPNPFRASTRIQFLVETARVVNVSVFDLQGRRVAELAERGFAQGVHTVEWDGRHTDGSPGAAGVYFVVLESEGTRHSRKVVLTR